MSFCFFLLFCKFILTEGFFITPLLCAHLGVLVYPCLFWLLVAARGWWVVIMVSSPPTPNIILKQQCPHITNQPHTPLFSSYSLSPHIMYFLFLLILRSLVNHDIFLFPSFYYFFPFILFQFFSHNFTLSCHTCFLFLLNYFSFLLALFSLSPHTMCI